MLVDILQARKRRLISDEISDPVQSLTFSTAGITCLKEAAAEHRWLAGTTAREQNACNR